MSAIFQRMLENVDDTLFDFAGQSQSMEERRNLFDSMRLLRKSARPLVESFEAALQGRKAAGVAAADFEEWTLVNDEAVEEDIVVSRVVARIEDAAKKALWEFTIRMENLPAADQQSKVFERLRPPEVTRAFRDSVGEVAIDPSTKLILFKLFERQLVSDSSTVYEGINLRLEAAGVSSKTLSRRDPHSHLPAGQPERRDPPEFVASYVNHVAPSYQIPDALNSVVSSAFGTGGGVGGGTAYGGVPGQPAATAGGPVGPGPALEGPGGRQRMSLVAQLLLDQTRGWNPDQSQAANQLLVPLLRIALGDPGFFSDPQHPARALLSSLVGAPQGADTRLAEVSDRLNSLASGVQTPGQVAPLSGAELRQFLLSQRSAGASTSARLEEGRAAAYQQIRTVGSGRDLPVGVSGFLNQIWLPMISAMHLKFGAESEEMRRAAQILQRLFGEVRWLPEMKDSAVIQAILEELEKGLRDIAVPTPLITKARSVLADGLGQPETSRKLLDLETLTERAPAAAPAAANDLQKPGAPAPTAAAAKPAAFMGDDAAWRAALPVSSWFRVFDRASNQTQWLSAGVFYPQSRTLAFNGFDGVARLSIERSLFIGDLVDGKAEAVDPTELQASSIRLLCLEFAAARKQSDKTTGTPAA